MAPLVYSEQGYNLTENPFVLPQKFLEGTVCSKLWVEFLRTTTGGEPIEEKKQAANHAVFKIVFADAYNEYGGMRLEMAVDNNYKSKSDSVDGQLVKFQSGFLRVNPTSNSGPSSKTLSTSSLPIEPNWTVGRVIGLLLQYRASRFDFVILDNQYFGCRDFVTQAIYLMQTHGFIRTTEISTVISGPPLPVTSIFGALGLRFDYKGRISACPIDKGRFPSLQRYVLPSMPYKGSQSALELESIAQ
ncbi:hypothetical protein J3458_015163 [Metarhizium acridum]|uniref:uncharacterized protein n=1 Tax=Metarhizium acridum TaxID=92637 RepID=UPI001C6D287F|nr:hypothetical protein J3458_015163 [Metarhizium acridum]